MTNRDQVLLALRPSIPAALVTNTISEEERFQNETLRPILKLQNSLLLTLFQEYIQRRKNEFYQLPEPQRPAYVQQALQKDTVLRNTIKGIVIGHFTEVEWGRYVSLSQPIDKRMLQMAIQRLQSQLEAL